MTTHIFGIRHHGPGCARSLRAALERLEPDIVLVEGPPDAQAVLPLLTDEEMKPPVALLVYAPDAPQPRRLLSLRRLLARVAGAPLRADPRHPRALHRPAAGRPTGAASLTPSGETGASLTRPMRDAGRALAPAADAAAEAAPERRRPTRADVRDDPLAMLAEAAGYTDHELWWERQIEQRRDATDLFDGILEAMTALRSRPDAHGRARRRSARRTCARASARPRRKGFSASPSSAARGTRPALGGSVTIREGRRRAARRPAARQGRGDLDSLDELAALLSQRLRRGRRLARLVRAPLDGARPAGASAGWRGRRGCCASEGLDASSASVIEAVRLAEALAALRDLPMPGLAELHEATLTVLCHGDDAPMRLIRDKLEIGERTGRGARQRRPPSRSSATWRRASGGCACQPTAEIKRYDLDLRNDDRPRAQPPAPPPAPARHRLGRAAASTLRQDRAPSTSSGSCSGSPSSPSR